MHWGMYRRLKAGSWDRWNHHFVLIMVKKRLVSKKTGFKFFSDRFPLDIRQNSKPRRGIVTSILNIAKPSFSGSCPIATSVL